MSEERIYGDVAEESVVEESVAEQPAYEAPVYEAPVYEQAAPQEPVKAKKGFATACLVFGIFAFITTLFLVNYVFGLLSLLFGIIYLVKKADIKPKGKAITGIVLSIISLTVSTTLWVTAYNYVVKTDVTEIIEDVSSLMGQEIDGKEMLNTMISDATGAAMNLDTIEQFVGGKVTLERMLDFVGDIKEEEITAFVNEVQNMDPAIIQNIMAEFEGEITYEKLEEKLGKDFSLKELMDYVRSYNATPQQ